MPLIDPWLTSLLEATLKGSLILAAALAGTRLMRRTSAEARHAVLAIGLSAFLFLPAATMIAPAWTVTIPEVPFTLDIGLRTQVAGIPQPEPPRGVADARGPTAAGEPRGATVATAATASTATSRAAMRDEPATPIDWSRVLLAVWLAGTSLIALRLLVGLGRLWVLSRRSVMVTDAAWLHAAHSTARQLGLTRGVTLLQGEDAAAPMTWGVLQPVVWLPQSAGEWSNELRDAVLSHELAHVKRRDAVTQWLANIAVAVHWFNPLVWMAARALRVERERACDDTVLSLGTAAEEYAGQLLEIVRELGTVSNGPAPALAMARRSQLEGRLLAILDRAVDRGPVPSTGVLAVGTFAIVFVAVLAGAQVSRGAVLMAAEDAMRLEAIAATTEPARVEARASVGTAKHMAGFSVTSGKFPHGPKSEGTPPSAFTAPSEFAPPGAVARAKGFTSSGIASGPITGGRDWENLRAAIAGPDKVNAPPILPLAAPPLVPSQRTGSGRPPFRIGAATLLETVQTARASDTTLLLEIIAAADGITSTSERVTVLDKVANLPSLDSNVVTALAKAVGRTSGSTSRAKLLKTMIQKQPHARGASRRAVLDVVGKLSAPQDQATLLTLFLTEGTLTDSALVDGLCATERISSSTSKAQVLISTARARKIDGEAQNAYVRVAKSISSGNERARALTALLGDPGGTPR